jgi:hypothetical protein
VYTLLDSHGIPERGKGYIPHGKVMMLLLEKGDWMMEEELHGTDIQKGWRCPSKGLMHMVLTITFAEVELHVYSLLCLA